MIDIDYLIKNATLSKDKVAANAFKNIKVEFDRFKHAQKLERKLTDEIQLRIISTYAKKLEDAISQFSEAHRDDLVLEYTNELEVVKKLLPEPVDRLQVLFELGIWISNNGYFITENSKINLEQNPVWTADSAQIKPIPKKEMGTVIKYLKSKFPTVDGKMISDIVKEYII